MSERCLTCGVPLVRAVETHYCATHDPKSELASSAGSPAPSRHQELLQAVQDFVWNVEHHNVAGWGEVHVSTDTSFHVLKHALRKAQENEKPSDGANKA